jgi:hypothetical protein
MLGATYEAGEAPFAVPRPATTSRMGSLGDDSTSADQGIAAGRVISVCRVSRQSVRVSGSSTRAVQEGRSKPPDMVDLVVGCLPRISVRVGGGGRAGSGGERDRRRSSAAARRAPPAAAATRLGSAVGARRPSTASNRPRRARATTPTSGSRLPRGGSDDHALAASSSVRTEGRRGRRERRRPGSRLDDERPPRRARSLRAQTQPSARVRTLRDRLPEGRPGTLGSSDAPGPPDRAESIAACGKPSRRWNRARQGWVG